jgi:hypothetical protein
MSRLKNQFLGVEKRRAFYASYSTMTPTEGGIGKNIGGHRKVVLP